MEEKKENEIGQEGKFVHLSVAMRAINREPDLEQLIAHDDYPTTRSPLFYVALVLTAVAAGGSFYLYKNGFWVWGSLLLITTVLLILFTRSYGNPLLMKRIAYESGLLVPSIVVNTDPFVLLVLADMRAEEDQDAVFGCVKMQVNTLPHHVGELGEKVPCVALFGAAVKGYRRHFEPHPVGWGYLDASVVSQAVKAIADEEAPDTDFRDEWEMVDALKEKMDDAAHEEIRFFSRNLDPVSL